MYNKTLIRKSELLQLLLLDNLYAQSGSEHVIFQVGTALRWVYGGMRFSEDLDFVTDLPKKNIQQILNTTFKGTRMDMYCTIWPRTMPNMQDWLLPKFFENRGQSLPADLQLK